VVSQVRLYREILASSLVRHGGLRVAGQGTWVEALDQIAHLCPEILLLDLGTKENLAVPRRARAICPNLRVVAFAVAEVEAEILACAEAGICGYVTRDGTVTDVVDAVLRALSGELVCPPRIAALLFRRIGTLSSERPADEMFLTPREQEIASLLTRGLSNKHIARQLRLANATVKNHVHNILQKLNLERRGEIAALRLDAEDRRVPHSPT